MSIDSDTAHVITRLLVAGSFAAAACATAARRRFGYTVFYVLAAIETYAKLRYPASGMARDWLLGIQHTDDAKYVVQLRILAVAAIGGVTMLLVILWRLRRAPAELVLAMGTLGVLAVLAIETISYHFIDRVIYTVQWGVMRSGWMYVAAALVATIGALFTRRRRR